MTTQGSQMASAKKRKVAVPDVCETREPVNISCLKDLASRKASGVVCWPGWDVSIRTLLQAYLGRVGPDGMLPVTWREGGSLCDFGFATRRYAGGGWAWLGGVCSVSREC